MAEDIILESLKRIETNQTVHTASTDLRLQSIERHVSELLVKERVGQEVDKDHEIRLRANESILVKVTVFFTGASVIFGAVVTWAVDKLLSVAN